jgi:hypothetical protein
MPGVRALHVAADDAAEIAAGQADIGQLALGERSQLGAEPGPSRPAEDRIGDPRQATQQGRLVRAAGRLAQRGDLLGGGVAGQGEQQGCLRLGHAGVHRLGSNPCGAGFPVSLRTAAIRLESRLLHTRRAQRSHAHYAGLCHNPCIFALPIREDCR